MRWLAFCAWLAAALAPCMAVAGYIPAAPQPGPDGWTVDAGGHVIDVGNADDPAAPRLWQGDPMVIRHRAGGSCRIDGLGPVASIHVEEGSGRALVSSISGSYSTVWVLQLADCAVLDRLSAFTAGVRVDGDEVLIAPGCECGDDRSRCVCEAARVITVSPEGKLLNHPDGTRAERLTRDALGVGFAGRALIDSPRTAGARVVERLP
ncbi:MAG TPA: hypothetical protein VGE72_23980 [Azospirillum sp.]